MAGPYTHSSRVAVVADTCMCTKARGTWDERAAVDNSEQ